MWDDQVEVFAKDCMVIRYDLSGFGKSRVPTGPYRYHEDLKALLDFLGVAQAHVLGLSVGGGIAINFALHYSRGVGWKSNQWASV